MAGNVGNNPGNVSVQHGTIDVATIMGIANPSFKVNGQTMDFATAIAQLQFKKLTQNPYDSGGNKAIRVQAMPNEGTVQYTFMPAVLPVSNFSQSDMGNRSFGTQMNVFGKNIMFLQTNFGTNEFVALTSENYLDNIQKMLLGTYSKSIAIMKTELSIMENALFCLATGQYLFADEIGKKILQDPSDPNNLLVGTPQILGSTRQPRKDALDTFLGNIPQAFLKQELNALSTGLMTGGMTITTFAVGYSIDQLALACSYYMRSNLAMALNLGGPTDTNMQLVNRPSFVATALSQGFNLVLTDVNTMPYFQNEVGLVTQESMGQVNANGTFSGQPLGYGINNICNMNYTKNIIGMTVYAGALDQYYTTEVPFNPYNIASSKTGYRLGYTGGGGQVHVPNFGGTSGMFLDPNAYIEVLNLPGAYIQGAEYTGSALKSPQGLPINDPTLSGVTTSSIQFTGNVIPNVKVPGGYIYATTGTTAGTYELTSDPSTPGAYQAYLSLNGTGSDFTTVGTDPCALPGSTSGAALNIGSGSDFSGSTVGYYDATGQFVSTTVSSLGNYSTIQTDEVFADPIYAAVYVPANSGNTSGNFQFMLYTYHLNQLLDDMTQAQAVELSGEPNMGYDTYCFQSLPSDINQPLARGSYTTTGGSQTFTPLNIQLPSGDTATIGNSCGLTFAQGAMTRSLRALSMNMQVTNSYNTITNGTTGKPAINNGQLNLIPNGTRQLLDMVRVGYDQLYMQPFQYLFNMPNGAPYISDPGYSQAPGTQMSYGSK